MVEGIDRAREEFFAEAQEIVDALGRDLLGLDEGVRASRVDPELINNVFRAVHTLKGLAGLFGATRMASLSHELEELLDKLRLGKIELTQQVLDLLNHSIDLYVVILHAEKDGRDQAIPQVDDLIQRIQRSVGGEVEASPSEQYDLDPNMMAMLTEYEEHRLREAIRTKFKLYRLRVQFKLATIDAAINDLKATAKPHGEIITYLPTGEGADADSIELDILMASSASAADLRKVMNANGGVELTEVPRRAVAGPRRQAVEPLSVAESSAPGMVRSEEAPITPDDKESAGAPGSTRDAGRMSPGELSTIKPVVQMVRVDIRKLDRLMNIVGELALVRSSLARHIERVRSSGGDREDLVRLHRLFERRLGEMQQGILEVRMVPLGQVFDKLARGVRTISRELDKGVNLVITGAETEVDKLIVEELSDPLLHMLRNAIDHGIESKDERERVGKPALGTIALNAFQKGNHVVIEVEDDGAGIKTQRLIDRAIEQKKLTVEEARTISKQESFNLVFLRGLSTKPVASTISGRGIGMDVVKENISKLGGIIDIQSEVGIGTKMTVTLPITLAIIKALIVHVGGQLFAIPLANIQEAVPLDPSAVRTIDGREVVTLRGSTLQLCRLARIFGLEGQTYVESPPDSLASIPPGWGGVAPVVDSGGSRSRGGSDARLSGRTGQTGKQYIVVTSVGVKRLGLVVGMLDDEQDVVIKALGPSLKGVRGFAGASELGDQRIALVIDAAALVEETHAPGERARAALEPRGGHG